MCTNACEEKETRSRKIFFSAFILELVLCREQPETGNVFFAKVKAKNEKVQFDRDDDEQRMVICEEAVNEELGQTGTTVY